MDDAPHRRQGVVALPYRGFAAFRFQLSTCPSCPSSGYCTSVVPSSPKSSWITAALDGSVPLETLSLLLDVSYELTRSNPHRKAENRKGHR